MTQAPHVLRGARSGFRLGEGKLEDSLMVALLDTYCGLYMAQTSDNLAQRARHLARGDGRVRAAAASSAPPRRWSAASSGTRSSPWTSSQGRKTMRVEVDDHLRPETTLEGLAALRPAFGKDGFVTAGNASGIVDGAAALVVASREEAQARGLQPIASRRVLGNRRRAARRSWASGPCRRRARRLRPPASSSGTSTSSR